MRILSFLVLLSGMAGSSGAQVAPSAPLFSHEAITCLTTEHFPLVEAAVDPAELDLLRKAQVYFKARQSTEWYFVEMEPVEGSRLRAVLPRPLAETERVDYYLFFLTGNFETSQTQELSAAVSEDGCEGVRGAIGPSTASLTLKATLPNQLPIPPGFQPTGIESLITTSGSSVAAGASAGAGGVSGATVGIVAGAGAAAAGTAVAVGASGDDDTAGGDGDTGDSGGIGVGNTASETPEPPPPPPPPPSPPPPEPEPPPEPAAVDVAGTWLMSNRITDTCYPEDLGRTSDRLMAIEQDGTSLTATFVQTSNQGNFRGSIDMAGNLRLNGRVVDTEGATSDVTLEATVSGASMSGTMRTVYVHNGCVVRATFTGRKR